MERLFAVKQFLGVKMIFNTDLIQKEEFHPKKGWILVASEAFVSDQYQEVSNFYWIGGEFYILHWERKENSPGTIIREFFQLYTCKTDYLKALKAEILDYKTDEAWEKEQSYYDNYRTA